MFARAAWLSLLSLSAGACGDDERPPPGGEAGYKGPPPGFGGGGLGAGGSSQQGTCRPAQEPFGVDPTFGESFPDVDVTDCRGLIRSLDQARCESRLTLISVGAGWCQPCVEEAPVLQQLTLDNSPADFRAVQVLFADGQGQPATAEYCQLWRDTLDINYAVYVDPERHTLPFFDNSSLPLTVIVDRDGRALWSTLGGLPDDIEQVVSTLLIQD